MPPAVVAPPLTPVEPITEVLHGVEVTDPYRWLEDQNSPRTRHWLEEQASYTRAYFDAIPGREKSRKRVEELLSVESVSEPWEVGRRVFFLKRAPDQEHAVVMMRDLDRQEDFELVDPSRAGDRVAASVEIADISSDGKFLAYSRRENGSDAAAVEVMDVDRRAVLSDRLPLGSLAGFVFAGRGFYYSHTPTDSNRPHYHSTKWHAFGKDSSADIEIYVAGNDPDLMPGCLGSQDGRFLLHSVYSAQTLRGQVLLHDTGATSPPASIASDIELFLPFFARDQLIALTNLQAPNGRVVAIDPRNSKRDAWRELVPEASYSIREIAVLSEHILVSYVDGVASRVDIFDMTGRKVGVLPCPAQGTVSFMQRRTDQTHLFYRCMTFSDPPSIHRFDDRTCKQDLWAQSLVPFDSSSIEVERVSYRSKDGTYVPMFLVAKKGSLRLGPLPTVLTGYGGFGVPMTPQFSVVTSCLVEHGCLVAVANVRGGSELGAEWHLAAKRHKRQNAVNDFLAAGEWLIAGGHTATDKLAIAGGSNAGLLVGAALTQKPEMFRAAICLGPLLDMLRYHIFDTASWWVDEYGSATNVDDFAALREYSPYQRVQEGVAYPAVMLISGDADTRCNPMHARKMAARLQGATSSGRPVLLDYKMKWGHYPVLPLSERIDAVADRLTFLCHEIGVHL